MFTVNPQYFECLSTFLSQTCKVECESFEHYLFLCSMFSDCSGKTFPSCKNLWRPGWLLPYPFPFCPSQFPSQSPAETGPSQSPAAFQQPQPRGPSQSPATFQQPWGSSGRVRKNREREREREVNFFIAWRIKISDHKSVLSICPPKENNLGNGRGRGCLRERERERLKDEFVINNCTILFVAVFPCSVRLMVTRK